MLTRRHFIGLCGAAIATGPVTIMGRRAHAQDAGLQGVEYSFPLLGDIHYDQWEHHDMDWVRREKPNDIRQIEGYVDVSNKYTPRLLDLTRQMVRASVAPVPFVVQIGDFVEGLCGSYDLQALQFRDAMKLVDQSKLGAPFLLAKGNHDITGPGAHEAFDEVLLPWMAKQAGQRLTSANYYVRHGEDLFVFFDAYRPDLDYLEQVLRDEPARHVFFVVHPPVMPYNARANWHLFARDRQAEDRKRLIRLLGESRAIVLSGHLHKYNLMDREDEHGLITQVGICSVIRDDDPTPRQVLDGAQHYDPETLLGLNPDFSPKSRSEREGWIAAEAPHIRRYQYARTEGLAMVHVGPSGVTIDVYNGLNDAAWRQEPVTALRNTGTPS